MSVQTSTLLALPEPAAAVPSKLRPLAYAFARWFAHAALGLIVPLLLLALWQYAVSHRWMPEQILPPPQLVWQSLIELYQSGDLGSNVAISLKRVGWSLLLGGGIGITLGFAFGFSRTVRAYLYPSFEVLSQLPVIGWIPLLIILVGIGEPLKIVAISLAVLVPVTVHIYKGIVQVPNALLDVARVYRFSLPQVVWRVVLPSALPTFFSGLRQAVMQAWLSLVFVELLAAGEGIGYVMVWGRQLLQLDLVVVAMLVIGAIGVLLDVALTQVEKRLQTWRRSAF